MFFWLVSSLWLKLTMSFSSLGSYRGYGGAVAHGVHPLVAQTRMTQQSPPRAPHAYDYDYRTAMVQASGKCRGREEEKRRSPRGRELVAWMTQHSPPHGAMPTTTVRQRYRPAGSAKEGKRRSPMGRDSERGDKHPPPDTCRCENSLAGWIGCSANGHVATPERNTSYTTGEATMMRVRAPPVFFFVVIFVVSSWTCIQVVNKFKFILYTKIDEKTCK
jgi:hypothetical protein